MLRCTRHFPLSLLPPVPLSPSSSSSTVRSLPNEIPLSRAKIANGAGWNARVAARLSRLWSIAHFEWRTAVVFTAIAIFDIARPPRGWASEHGVHPAPLGRFFPLPPSSSSSLIAGDKAFAKRVRNKSSYFRRFYYSSFLSPRAVHSNSVTDKGLFFFPPRPSAWLPAAWRVPLAVPAFCDALEKLLHATFAHHRDELQLELALPHR